MNGVNIELYLVRYFLQYIYSLLERLKQFGIGYHIGRTYAGVFGYVDDVAFRTPSLSGLKRKIKTCLC